MWAVLGTILVPVGAQGTLWVQCSRKDSNLGPVKSFFGSNFGAFLGPRDSWGQCSRKDSSLGPVSTGLRGRGPRYVRARLSQGPVLASPS